MSSEPPDRPPEPRDRPSVTQAANRRPDEAQQRSLHIYSSENGVFNLTSPNASPSDMASSDIMMQYLDNSSNERSRPNGNARTRPADETRSGGRDPAAQTPEAAAAPGGMDSHRAEPAASGPEQDSASAERSQSTETPRDQAENEGEDSSPGTSHGAHEDSGDGQPARGNGQHAQSDARTANDARQHAPPPLSDERFRESYRGHRHGPIMYYLSMGSRDSGSASEESSRKSQRVPLAEIPEDERVCSICYEDLAEVPNVHANTNADTNADTNTNENRDTNSNNEDNENDNENNNSNSENNENSGSNDENANSNTENDSNRMNIETDDVGDTAAGSAVSSRAPPQRRTRPPAFNAWYSDSRSPSFDAATETAAHEAGHYGTRMPCGHVFGNSCLRLWLNDNITCPSCRERIENPWFSRPRLTRIPLFFDTNVVDDGLDEGASERAARSRAAAMPPPNPSDRGTITEEEHDRIFAQLERSGISSSLFDVARWSSYVSRTSRRAQQGGFSTSRRQQSDVMNQAASQSQRERQQGGARRSSQSDSESSEDTASVGSQSDTASAPATNEPGAEPGAEPGTEPGAEPGTDQGTDQGTDHPNTETQTMETQTEGSGPADGTSTDGNGEPRRPRSIRSPMRASFGSTPTFESYFPNPLETGAASNIDSFVDESSFDAFRIHFSDSAHRLFDFNMGIPRPPPSPLQRRSPSQTPQSSGEQEEPLEGSIPGTQETQETQEAEETQETRETPAHPTTTITIHTMTTNDADRSDSTSVPNPTSAADVPETPQADVDMDVDSGTETTHERGGPSRRNALRQHPYRRN